MDERLDIGATVYVWVDDAENDTPIYEKNELTRQMGGGLTGEETMYFPESENNVNIYALHTNAPELEGMTDYPENVELTHSVSADQRSSGGGYAISDLVGAWYRNVPGQTNAVPLTFYHLLSKVEIVLKEGNGEEGFLDNISKLELVNLGFRFQFTLSNSGLSTSYVNPYPGNQRDIEIDAGITGNEAGEDILNEAIIVPQRVNAGEPFIRITLEDGGEFVYNMPSTTDFDGGRKYKYVITVNQQAGLRGTSEISDWDDDGDDDEGSANTEYPD